MTLQSSLAPPATLPTPAVEEQYPLPEVPTFSPETGWREVYDPETRSFHQEPLTLLELLFPNKNDAEQGVVVMAESPWHDIWTKLLAVMLRSYLATRDWLVLSDVYLLWGRPNVPRKAPDVAVIPGGQLPPPSENSYRVGRDGPMPAFVIEVTSEETRLLDLYEKNLLYAALGIKEMLVIDLLPEIGSDWQLLGYRLEDRPYYRRIQPDAEGGLTFETVGLRFVVSSSQHVGHQRIEIYDAASGERLLTPDELKARVTAEAAARASAEARVAELEARLRALEQTAGQE